MSNPEPDEFGRYRVAEHVGGRTRHYSTKRFLPDVHKIVTGPDAAASYPNGQARPAKFPKPAPTTTPTAAEVSK